MYKQRIGNLTLKALIIISLFLLPGCGEIESQDLKTEVPLVSPEVPKLVSQEVPEYMILDQEPITEVSHWQLPSLEQAAAVDYSGSLPEGLQALEQIIFEGLDEIGAIKVGEIEFYSTGSGEDYRWVMLPRNDSGEAIWAYVEVDGLNYHSPWPILFTPEGSVATDDIVYSVIPDSEGSEIVWVADDELPTLVNDVVTLPDGRQVLARSWDFEANGGEGEWVMTPGVGEYGYLYTDDNQFLELKKGKLQTADIPGLEEAEVIPAGLDDNLPSLIKGPKVTLADGTETSALQFNFETKEWQTIPEIEEGTVKEIEMPEEIKAELIDERVPLEVGIKEGQVVAKSGMWTARLAENGEWKIEPTYSSAFEPGFSETVKMMHPDVDWGNLDVEPIIRDLGLNAYRRRKLRDGLIMLYVGSDDVYFTLTGWIEGAVPFSLEDKMPGKTGIVWVLNVKGISEPVFSLAGFENENGEFKWTMTFFDSETFDNKTWREDEESWLWPDYNPEDFKGAVVSVNIPAFYSLEENQEMSDWGGFWDWEKRGKYGIGYQSIRPILTAPEGYVYKNTEYVHEKKYSEEGLHITGGELFEMILKKTNENPEENVAFLARGGSLYTPLEDLISQ